MFHQLRARWQFVRSSPTLVFTKRIKGLPDNYQFPDALNAAFRRKCASSAQDRPLNNSFLFILCTSCAAGRKAFIFPPNVFVHSLKRRTRCFSSFSYRYRYIKKYNASIFTFYWPNWMHFCCCCLRILTLIPDKRFGRCVNKWLKRGLEFTLSRYR